MIKVSVIIPVVEQYDLVTRAIGSVPKRDDVETIIVMNGCKNKMRGIVYSYCQDDEHYRIVDVDEPLGCWGAMNVGLSYAKGEYIYQLDEDDVLNTNAFNKIVDNHLGSDLVYVNLQINDGTVWHINEDNRSGLTDHTSFIKRSFLGDDKFDNNGVSKIDGGYLLLNRLIKREHTRTFTDIVVYYYNYPRVNSLYYNATH